VDETPWYQAKAALHWLWILCNSQMTFFMIHAKRNKEAFKTLIDRWTGILVSDDYGVYRKWVNLNQNCLSHLVRRAKALAQMKDPEIAKCGAWATKELYKLMAMANAPPTKGQSCNFITRFPACLLCQVLSVTKTLPGPRGSGRYVCPLLGATARELVDLSHGRGSRAYQQFG